MNKTKHLSSIVSVLNISRRLLVILWREDKKLFIGNTFATIIPGIIPYINAYVYALIINFIISVIGGHHHNYSYLYLLILIRILMLFVQDVAFTAQQRYLYIFNNKIPLIFSQAMMKQLSRLDIPLIENSDFQDKFQGAKDNAVWRPSSMLTNIFYSMQSLIQLLIAAASLFLLNWVFGMIILLTALPTFFYQAKNAKNVWSIWSENSPYRKRFNYLYYQLQDPRSVKELKIFHLTHYFAKQNKIIGDKFASENLAILNKNFLSGLISNLVNVAGYGVVEVYIFLITLSKRISIGSLTYFTTALFNFQSGVNGLFRITTVMFDDSQYVKEIFEILDIEPKIISPSNPVVLNLDKAPIIEFKNVSFSYQGSDKKVLDNLNIIIKPGEKVAFVGENGAGKTTLIKLLCRFYDVDETEILINGINIKQLDLDTWYEHIGVIFQDFLKYEYTLRENIWFGRVNKPELMELIIKASNQSGADAVEKTLKNGYDQMLGNTFKESIELSTGQWQKVALARGFYRNAPVLILDEPTSAIDARAEQEIFKKVEKLTVDKTAIIISHRFSTVRNANKIYVIDNGKVIESGTHKELMETDGIYADLFNLQAEAYR